MARIRGASIARGVDVACLTGRRWAWLIAAARSLDPVLAKIRLIWVLIV
jgi:hypothetical protein